MFNVRGVESSGFVKSMAGTPGAKTSTVTGTGVDFSGTDDLVMATQNIGTVSGTTPTLDGKFQESDDDSAYTDIVGATFTQVTASTNLQTITFQRTKKYIRYVGTIAGTTPSFAASVLAVARLKKY